MKRTIAACVIALVLGYIAARHTQPPAPEQADQETAARIHAIEAQLRRQAERAVARPQLDPGAVREVIRDTLRQELGALERGDAVEKPAPERGASDESSSAQRAAHDRGAAVLESALTARQWRDTDRRAMLGAMAGMGIAQRKQLVSRLFTALNHGELRLMPGTSAL